MMVLIYIIVHYGLFGKSLSKRPIFKMDGCGQLLSKRSDQPIVTYRSQCIGEKPSPKPRKKGNINGKNYKNNQKPYGEGV